MEVETKKTQYLNDVRDIICDIDHKFKEPEIDCDGYLSQRANIKHLFELFNGEFTISSITIQLTVIDSLYSTNARYAHFSIDELAKKLYSFDTEEALSEYFYSLVNGHKDDKKIFKNNYGIRTNGDKGARLTSLISKYAYYLLKQNPNKYPLGFPIYDSLVVEMYPKVYELLFSDNEGTSKYKMQMSIESFIDAINKVREKIFDFTPPKKIESQQFDLLDAYFWRIGKINRGNYTLLLNRKDYEVIARLKKEEITEATLKKIENELFVKIFKHWETFFK